MKTVHGERLRYQEIVSTGPASLPIHRDEIKRHVRLGTDITEEDSLLDNYIREATIAVEQDSGRALVCQTRKLYLDQFPINSRGTNTDDRMAPDIELRGCPVIAVDSIKYVDYEGTTQTWDSDSYQVNAADEPCRVRYVWGGMWPVAILAEKAITVTYSAGYVVPITIDANTDRITLRGLTPVNGDKWRVSNSGGVLPGGLHTMTDYYIVGTSGQTCQLSLTAGGSPVNLLTGGYGLQFLGEMNPLASMAIALRVAMSYVDREGAEYEQCHRGYWSKIYSLRYEGV